MPFTVSHVAAVLPGHRLLARAQVFSAAVIGSMVTDFGLLLPEKLARWQTHSIPALLHFCLPVGLAAYVLMLLLIKPAVLQIVPDGPYLRLRDADFTALLRTAPSADETDTRGLHRCLLSRCAPRRRCVAAPHSAA